MNHKLFSFSNNLGAIPGCYGLKRTGPVDREGSSCNSTALTIEPGAEIHVQFEVSTIMVFLNLMVSQRQNHVTRLLLLALLLVPSHSQSLLADDPSTSEEETGTEEPSLDEISRQLENPLTSLWSLTFQENYSIIEGDAVDGQDWTNNLFFQPALPVPVGANKDKVLIVRPVFPWVRSAYPVYDPDSGDVGAGSETGFGDMQVFAMVGPNRTTGKVWGLGVTFKFDTASEESLGQGKNQAGPALMFINLSEKWTTGFVAQHWWSFSGDDSRDDTSQTDFQYIMRRRLPGGWSIGMGPTITYNWKVDSGDRLTVPIGLGITKTVRWGKTPVKLRLEPQYSIVRPDNLGVTWNVRLQITPVIKSPFMN